MMLTRQLGGMAADRSVSNQAGLSINKNGSESDDEKNDVNYRWFMIN